MISVKNIISFMYHIVMIIFMKVIILLYNIIIGKLILGIGIKA